MKPSPSNQPFSSNDINYIVLLGSQHPAIKSNHGSLANLFTCEAAVSFLPCPPPPFIALHEHDVRSEGRTAPKPLCLRRSARSHRSSWSTWWPHGSWTGFGSQPVAPLQEHKFRCPAWFHGTEPSLTQPPHHPGANPGSCCQGTSSQSGAPLGAAMPLLGTCCQASVLG